MKAILIDSSKSAIAEIEYENLADIQRLVGGYIEAAVVNLPTGDVLYVNEDGFHMEPTGFFLFPGYAAPLAGCGLVVGPEWEDANGFGTRDPASTVASIEAAVRFLTRDQVDAWGKANASEPAVSFTSIGPNGRMETEVIQRIGTVIAGIPRAGQKNGAEG